MKLFAALLGLFLFTGCEFQTDKTYFRDINKNVVAPDLQVYLNMDQDTIYVYGNAVLKLNLLLTNKKLQTVKFYVNDVEIQNVFAQPAGHYSVIIDIQQKPLTKVKVEIYTSTETGSIADKTGSESFVYKSKEWTLLYTSDMPVCTTEIVDGRLKLSWTPNKNSSIRKYYVTQSGYMDSTTVPWYIDSSYIGGRNSYYIRCDNNDPSSFYTSTDIYYPYPKIYINSRDSVTVCWNKSLFYNNLHSYKIKMGFQTVAEKEASDTVYIPPNMYFGDNLSLDFYCTSRKKPSEDIYISHLGVPYGLYFILRPVGTYFFPLTGNKFYFTNYYSPNINGYYIYQFSLDNKTVIDSIHISSLNKFTVSANNKYLLYSEPADIIYFVKTDSMVILRSKTLNEILNSNVLFGLSLSDAGTSVFYNYTLGSLVVYDWIAEKIINTIPVSQALQQFKISASGRYIFDRQINTLFRLDAGSYAKIWGDENKSFQFSYFEFSPDASNQIALYDGTTFYLKNCGDFSTVKSFSLNNSTVVNVDFIKKKILSYIDYELYVYDLNTGNLLNTIPSYYTYSTHLFNDYIFGGNSNALNLNHLSR